MLEEEEKEEEEEEEEGHEEELGVKGRKLTYEEKQDPNYSAIVKFLSVLVVEDDHHTACVHDSCLQIAGRRSVVISATKQTTPFTGVCHPIVGVVLSTWMQNSLRSSWRTIQTAMTNGGPRARRSEKKKTAEPWEKRRRRRNERSEGKR